MAPCHDLQPPLHTLAPAALQLSHRHLPPTTRCRSRGSLSSLANAPKEKRTCYALGCMRWIRTASRRAALQIVARRVTERAPTTLSRLLRQDRQRVEQLEAELKKVQAAEAAKSADKIRKLETDLAFVNQEVRAWVRSLEIMCGQRLSAVA